MHPLRTFVGFRKWRKYSSKSKSQIKLGTYLGKLTPSKYLGPHKVSACWSSCIFTAAVNETLVYESESVPSMYHPPSSVDSTTLATLLLLDSFGTRKYLNGWSNMFSWCGAVVGLNLDVTERL